MTEKSLEVPKIDPLVQHRRDVRRKIVLPVLASAMLLILGAIGLGALAFTDNITGQQIGVIAACLVTVFVLIPIVLLLLALDALMLVTAFASGMLRGYLIKPLGLLRGYAEKSAEITAEAAESITAPVIALRTQSAFLRNFVLGPLGFLDDDDKDDSKKTK